METFILLWWVFLSTWFFGGIAFFAWLDWTAHVRRAKKAYQLSIEGAKFTVMLLMMMAPFFIPIAVTVISLFFGP